MTPREQAMEALQPFAKFAELVDVPPGSEWGAFDDGEAVDGRCEGAPTIGDCRNALAALRALQEEAAAPPQDGWRSMESAPKDGTRIDVWAGGRRCADVCWMFGRWIYWHDQFRARADQRQVGHTPTHWRPLPAPPTDEEG